MTQLDHLLDHAHDAGACTCPGGTVPVYREYHEPECPLATSYDRLRWAQAMLADPRRAAVEMSGMSREEIAELRREFEGPHDG